MKKRRQKSPVSEKTEQLKKTTKINYILKPMSADVKFVYERPDVIEEAQKHPEKINSIIKVAEDWGASAYTMELLYLAKYGKWKWQM